MKTIRLFVLTLALLVFTPMAFAQDYDYYLRNARQCVANGDCAGAQRNYTVYKQLTKKTDKALEQMIAECGSNAPLTQEELKSAGFRFLKEYSRVTVLHQPDNQKNYIYNVGSHIGNNMSYYGGRVSQDGQLNGVIIIDKGGYKYLAYVCEGKLAYPLLDVGFYDNGLYMSLEEGFVSYGCIFPSWNGNYSDRGLCVSMREVYGKDFSNSTILREIYNATIDLTSMEKAFKDFVRNGNQLDDSWSSDPQYTDRYEGFEPIIEGYKPGEFDETIDQYRPINNGVLVYSQIPEFYCDGEYEYDEPRHKNGHALHTPVVNLNPNHFRVIFSFKAVSNNGWCQGHSVDEQWPLMSNRRNLGVRLNEDGSITIKTYDSKGKDHYYVTGYKYPINRYFDIDMEYDHGQFIINGHRFNISIDLKETINSFDSVNYSDGNAFKGFIKGLKIYSYPD